MTARPFAIEHIDHVLLLVDGMEEALAFYEGVLGLTVEARLPQFGMAELRAGSSHIDLVDTACAQGRWALPPVSGGRNVDHLALRLGPHAEADLRGYLSARGMAIVEERANDGAGGASLSLYVRDPSGNVIELMGPLR